MKKLICILTCIGLGPLFAIQTITEVEPNGAIEYTDSLGLQLTKWSPQQLGSLSGDVKVSGELSTANYDSYRKDLYQFVPAVSGDATVSSTGAALVTCYDCSYFGTAGCAFGYAMATTRFISRVTIGTESQIIRVVAGCTYFLHVSGTMGKYTITLGLPGKQITEPTLTDISITGASSVSSGGTETYACKASYSTGKTKTVTPTWSISAGTSYASISSAGVLTAKTVSSAQAVTVMAVYSEGSVTKTNTKTVTVNPVAASDLMFYQPSGWKNKLIISTTTGTSMDGASFTTDDKLYLDFSVKNVGGTFSSSIYVDIYVDGTTVGYWPYVAGLASGKYCTWTDKPIGPLTAGSHTIQLQIRNDAQETVTSNNTYSRTITVDKKVDSVMVTFDANGGYFDDGVTTACSMYDRTDHFGQMETPQKSGYTFAGWFTKESGGTQVYSTTTVSSAVGFSASSATLYAHWTETVSLSSISISGASSVASGKTASYICAASYSNGTTRNVTPTWSISSGASYASISSSGVLTAKTVTSVQTVTVKASYTEGSVTKTAAKNIVIQTSDGNLHYGEGSTDFGEQAMPFVVKGTFGKLNSETFSFVAGETITCKVWLDSPDDDLTSPHVYLKATISAGAVECCLKKTDVATISFVKGNTYTVFLASGNYSSANWSANCDFAMQFGGDSPKIPFVGVPEMVHADVVGSQVEVSWSRVEGAKGYVVYRQWNNGKVGGPNYGSKLTEVDADSLTYVDVHPITGVNVYDEAAESWYYVRAVNDETLSRLSEASNKVSVPEVASMSSDFVLRQGWTWISVYVTPSDASFASVFKAVAFADEDVIKSSGGSATYYGGKWYGELTTIKPGVAYMVKMSAAGSQTLTVAGEAAEASVDVVSGWNWIGPTATAEVSLDALTHSGGFTDEDVIKSEAASATYYGGKWYGELKSLQPGVGYKARFAKSGTLAFSK